MAKKTRMRRTHSVIISLTLFNGEDNSLHGHPRSIIPWYGELEQLCCDQSCILFLDKTVSLCNLNPVMLVGLRNIVSCKRVARSKP